MGVERARFLELEVGELELTRKRVHPASRDRQLGLELLALGTEIIQLLEGPLGVIADDEGDPVLAQKRVGLAIRVRRGRCAARSFRASASGKTESFTCHEMSHLRRLSLVPIWLYSTLKLAREQPNDGLGANRPLARAVCCSLRQRSRRNV